MPQPDGENVRGDFEQPLVVLVLFLQDRVPLAPSREYVGELKVQMDIAADNESSHSYGTTSRKVLYMLLPSVRRGFLLC
jgi:hypothetical protein